MISLNAISSVVFHATSLSSLRQILTENKFRLSTSIGTDAEITHQKGKLFYFSTARTRLGGYHVDNSGFGSVLLTLDGQKLNNKYSGKAIDYWGEEFRKHKKGKYEEEDRIFSNEPTIEKALSYIKRVDIFLSDWHEQKDKLRDIVRECLKYKIPLYFFSSSKDWLSGNIKRSYKIPISELKISKVSEDNMSWLGRNRTKEQWGRGFRRRNYIWYWQELVFINDRKSLSTEASELIGKMVYDYFNEQRTIFKNEIHNGKRDPAFVDKLLKLLKATKAKTANELYDFILNKWKNKIQ